MSSTPTTSETAASAAPSTLVAVNLPTTDNTTGDTEGTEDEHPSAANEDRQQRTKQITKEAKDDLRKYFTGPPKWPRNKQMPKIGTDGELDQIIARHCLKRNQASRQLRHFKEKEYSHSQIDLIINPEIIEQSIRDSLSMSSVDLVVSLCSQIIDGANSTASSDSVIFWSVIYDMGESAVGVVEYLAKNAEHQCVHLLSNLIDGFTQIAAEEFPKLACDLLDSEIQFNKKRISRRNEVFVPLWLESHSTIHPAASLTREEFGYLGMHLEACLLFEWSDASVDSHRPVIEFPDTNLVGKFAMPVLYYVAGWTLSSVALAKSVAQNKRRVFNSFATKHCLTQEEATNAKLPIEIVVQRQHKSLSFSDGPYFQFTCYIASVYLNNLNLKMMMAYNEGDVLEVIHNKILEDDASVVKFSLFFDGLMENWSLVSKKDVMKYILTRYVHMRGCWFVRHLRGNRGGSLGTMLVENAATRTKVAHAVATSKAVAIAKSEKELYDTALKNIDEYISVEDEADECL